MAEIYLREYQTKAHHLKVGILKGYPEPSVDDLDFGVGLRPDTIAFYHWRQRTGVRFVDVLKVRDRPGVYLEIDQGPRTPPKREPTPEGHTLVHSLAEFDRVFPEHPNRDAYVGHFMRTNQPIAAASPGMHRRGDEQVKWYITQAQFEAAYPPPALGTKAAVEAAVRDALPIGAAPPRIVWDDDDVSPWLSTLDGDARDLLARLKGENEQIHEDRERLEDEVAKRDAVIAEMTRTIAGLRGVPETVEPGYGVENLAMVGRWGR